MLHLCGCWIIMGLPTSLKVHKVQGHVFFAHRYGNSSQLACPSRARLAPSLPPRAPPAPFLRPSAPAPARPPGASRGTGGRLHPGPRRGAAGPGRGLPTSSGRGEAAAAPGAARGRVGPRTPSGHPALGASGLRPAIRPRKPKPGQVSPRQVRLPAPRPPPGVLWLAEASLRLWAPSAGKDFVGVQERPESP